MGVSDSPNGHSSPLATKRVGKSTMPHTPRSRKQMLDQRQGPAGNKTGGTAQDVHKFLCLKEIESFVFFAGNF